MAMGAMDAMQRQAILFECVVKFLEASGGLMDGAKDGQFLPNI